MTTDGPIKIRRFTVWTPQTLTWGTPIDGHPRGTASGGYDTEAAGATGTAVGATGAAPLTGP